MSIAGLFRREEKKTDLYGSEYVAGDIIRTVLDYVHEQTTRGILPEGVKLAETDKGNVLVLRQDGDDFRYVIEGLDGELVARVQRKTSRGYNITEYIIDGGLYGEGNGPINRFEFPNLDLLGILHIVEGYISQSQPSIEK